MIFKETLTRDIIIKLKSKKWYRHGIYESILTWSVEFAPALSRSLFLEEGIDKDMENAIQLGGEFFIDENEFLDFCSIYDVKLGNGIPYLNEYIRHYNKDMDIALDKSREIGLINAKKINNQELAQLFVDHFECIKPLHHWLWSMEFLNKSFDLKIHQLMSKSYPDWSIKKIDQFLGDVSYNKKRQYFQKEQEEVIDLVNVNDSQINQLYERYKWLNLSFMAERPYTMREYKKRIMQMIKNRKQLVEQAEKRKQDEIIAESKFEKVDNIELKNYLLLMRELAYLKTYRIDVYTICFSLASNIRREIAKRLKLTYDEFLHCSVSEIADALKNGKINKEKIMKRKDWCVVKVDNEIGYFQGKAIKKIYSIVLDDNLRVDSFKGTVAYRGKIRGRARIIFYAKDINRVKKGEILVCNLTNPDFNPVFKKVSGIITDEGGVLCHSAIMAREFKIPCIIGTKIATQVLKDGDMVEVDAEKGIVRILGK